MKKQFYLLYTLLLLFSTHLFAHVELNFPEGGDTFYSGDTVVVKWTELATHDTQNWELYYSADGGENWVTISNNIPYPAREFNWVVPNEETTAGKIKVYMNNGADTDYEDISAKFIIENATGIVQNQSISLVFNTFEIVPNPVQSISHFQFETDQTTQVSISIYALDGKRVEEISNQRFYQGVYRIPWNSQGMKSGTYLCVVQSGDDRKTFKFQIPR